ncbi:hypothetical protein AGDE_15355 [Angomonas deanei]|uniref:Uncharacterized protein n=1 Tax=Angomonas deanei TaxID=59799 RepID=A0A7G2CAJ4_9TRYP|nr:hypothetical protein AGDE_15355 [Angomonas deanei]CAD2216091.1 hypothetical protein, conserved [Angomonas deanei]|eukprot:EPY19225.1 hypothetical protein AGDE_15355 [Angomonas deanei]
MVLENDGEASRKRLDAASHPTHPHKRPREDDATTHRPDSADDPLQSLFPSPLQRLQDRLTTLQSVLDRKEASIRQLQQLVQRREEELSQQAQQLETTRAEEEVRRGRQQAKMGDLAQANKTLSADLASKTQELEDTKEKMAKLARKALEFRSVVVACGRYLGLTDNNNAVPDVEEVLKKLREGTKQ